MSSEEDRKLLEAVRNWKPPQQLHPIAMASFTIYAENENDLPPKGMQELRNVLDEYGEDLESLAAAMEGMIRFMIYIGEHLGDKDNAEKVTKLLREYADRFQPFWERVAEALENEGEDLQANFKAMTGLDLPKAAPVYGEKAPPGSVQLKDIAPPPRPPPWAPKDKK